MEAALIQAQQEKLEKENKKRQQEQEKAGEDLARLLQLQEEAQTAPQYHEDDEVLARQLQAEEEAQGYSATS